MQSPSVLVIHNRYQQPGGEDAVVTAEVNLLRAAGHRVIQFTRDNAVLARRSALRNAPLLLSTTWDRGAYREIRALIQSERPDIAHCHNLLPRVSPAAYYACKAAGVPVVQTLHNYRLLCPAGTLFAHGKRCQKCTRNLAHAAAQGCYRNSRLQSATVALMTGAHRLRGTWSHTVDAYLAPSNFCRDFFAATGLPSEKIHLKHNFLARDPGKRKGCGNYALFVGRLSAEKGALEMLDAWKQLADIPLQVAGDGPLYGQARSLAADSGGKVKLLGRLDSEQTLERIKEARFLVFPSLWYEPFGMALLEAAACGVPAIASRIGAVPELVIDCQTGLLFDPDNFTEFTDQVRWAWSHPQQTEAMGEAARELYQRSFTAEENYRSLLAIYREVLSN